MSVTESLILISAITSAAVVVAVLLFTMKVNGFGDRLNNLGETLAQIYQDSKEREEKARFESRKRTDEILFELRGVGSHVDRLDGDVKELKIRQDDFGRRIDRIENKLNGP